MSWIKDLLESVGRRMGPPPVPSKVLYDQKTAAGDWGRREGVAIPAPVSSYEAPAAPQNIRNLGRPELENLVKEAAKKHKVPIPLAMKVASAESNWDHKAVSPKGAVGVMQLMPSSFPGVDIHKPEVNIDAGMEYLAKLNKVYRDPTWRKPVIAYNMGPGNFDERGFNRKLWSKETIEHEKKIFGWDDRKLRRK